VSNEEPSDEILREIMANEIEVEITLSGVEWHKAGFFNYISNLLIFKSII
jgi:hypothetical protein